MDTVDHNTGFIISIFCIPYADFEVNEDCLGYMYTPTSICLFVYTYMTRKLPLPYPRCAQGLPIILSRCAQDVPNILNIEPIYAQDMPDMGPIYAEDRTNICPSCAKDIHKI